MQRYFSAPSFTLQFSLNVVQFVVMTNKQQKQQSLGREICVIILTANDNSPGSSMTLGSLRNCTSNLDK